MKSHNRDREDDQSSTEQTPDGDHQIEDVEGHDKPQEERIEPEVAAQSGKPVYRVNSTPPSAIVIHCGDPRFQEAFRNFITGELGITSYIPLVVGGGVHALAMQSFRPKNFKVLREQIKFFIKQQRPAEVIIINHEDCRWYEKMKGYHPRIDWLLKGKLDVLTAAKVILDDFPLIDVRAFWAALDGDTITFSELTGNKLP